MLLSALCALFGCSKAPEYTAEDIRSVSVSCGHMDYSHSYSFYLRKADGGWLLDADYATDTEHPHTVFEECPVTEEDATELISIVKEHDIVGKLRRYKRPKIGVQVADETSYFTSVLLASGEQPCAAAHVSDGLVNGFFRLAEKYVSAEGDTESAAINSRSERMG